MKHTVFDSTESYDEFIREEYPDIEEGSQAWYDEIQFQMDTWYETEMMNIGCITVDEGLVIIADLGRWNGRYYSVKEVRGYTVKDAIEQAYHRDYMDISFGVNDNNDLVYDGHHHDATDHFTIRKWRKGLSDEAKEKFMNTIYEQGAINLDWYTKPIGKLINNVYGWK